MIVIDFLVTKTYFFFFSSSNNFLGGRGVCCGKGSKLQMATVSNGVSSLILLLLALLFTVPTTFAKMRVAEDYRISIYNEISGLSSPILTGGSASDGRPPSFSSRRSTGTDPLGSKIKIAYDIQPKEEVVVLDHHEGILALDCEKANIFPSGLLELRVASASAFLNNLPEDALFSIGPGKFIKRST